MTLNHHQRRELRLIQNHLLTEQRRAGAAYAEFNTAGVVFHPIEFDPTYSLVIPHQGITWTRGEDVRRGFETLEERGRWPHLQYLDALFPQAFTRHLELHGFRHYLDTPVWLYMPLYGPVPEGETPFGTVPRDLPNIQIQEAISHEDFAVWWRTYRAGYYGVDDNLTDPKAIKPFEDSFQRGERVFLIGLYHDYPTAAIQVSFSGATAQVDEPAVVWPWAGFGIEETLIQLSVEFARTHGCEVIYSVGVPENDARLYQRLGFIQISNIVTFVEATPK
ncbi:MAG: GNAT family N-acetyltransferase [Chloroflexi bacterium]|nr:GNAT family N-acetyltransferase [Chloroflexota bacterium]